MECRAPILARLSRSASASEFADFASAVRFDGSKVRAGDAGVIDHADFHWVGSEADILAVFPGFYICATNAEAGIDAEHAFLPGNAINDARADADLFQVVIKGDGDELANGAGFVHLADVAQALAVSGFGRFRHSNS